MDAKEKDEPIQSTLEANRLKGERLKQIIRELEDDSPIGERLDRIFRELEDLKPV